MGTNGHHPCEAIAGEQSENAGQSPNPYEADMGTDNEYPASLRNEARIMTITAQLMSTTAVIPPDEDVILRHPHQLTTRDIQRYSRLIIPIGWTETMVRGHRVVVGQDGIIDTEIADLTDDEIKKAKAFHDKMNRIHTQHLMETMGAIPD